MLRRYPNSAGGHIKPDVTGVIVIFPVTLVQILGVFLDSLLSTNWKS